MTSVDPNWKPPLKFPDEDDPTVATLPEEIINRRRSVGSFKMVRVNPVRFWAIVRRLNAKIEYGADDVETFKYATTKGDVTIVSDPAFEINRGVLA